MVKLADAEWNIMELLWEKGPMTTMEISREMEESVGWARSTVITLLNRMDKKGSIYFEVENKSKKYYPKYDRDQIELEEAQSFLDRFYKGNIGLMVSQMLKKEALSKEEIEELQRIISDGE